MGGGMPGMGGGMGGNRGPSPKRQLTTLVRKLDLLSGEIAVNLTPDQAAAVVALVADLDGLKKLSDDDAKAKYEEILAVLTDDQRTKEDAVELPTRRPTGGGAPGGGPPPDPNANPFHEEENATALKSLRGRIGTLVAVSAEAEPENKPAP